LRAYAASQQSPSADRPTEEVWKALRADDRPVTSDYTIADKDVAGPFLEKRPSKMEEMKSIPELGYTNSREDPCSQSGQVDEGIRLAPKFLGDHRRAGRDGRNGSTRTPRRWRDPSHRR
jgi:hypothetical protein